jgi:ABC-2 type transport system permease protein
VSAWLIAEREFRAYVRTASFWAALIVTPLLMVVMLLATRPATPVHPTAVRIFAANSALASSTATALTDAANADGHPIILLQPGQAGAATRVEVLARTDGAVEIRLNGPLRLSTAARELLARTLELDSARQRLGARQPPARVVATPTRADAGAVDALGRIATVMMLWLTLTGSLGMLLQAVVRERGNHSLEGLLAGAGATDIVLGKLLGVGAVSALVLATWLGSAAALAPLTPASGGIASALLHRVAGPAALARDAAIYLFAFAFYGLVTIALGARARDSAAAQNLARPMFALLLVVFFVSLATSLGAGAGFAWLKFAAPFTPFVLLLEPPRQGLLLADLLAGALLVAATGLAGCMAVGGMRLDPRPLPPFPRFGLSAAK